MEATIPSSFSKLFYIHLSNTWRWMYTHKNIPEGSKQDCQKGSGKFPRLVPETLSRFPRQTYGKNKRFLRLLPTAMTNRWHFNFNDQHMAFWQHHDSVWESRTKLHQKHLFVTWSTPITDGFDTFSGVWGSFNLKKKVRELKIFSLGLSWILQVEARNQNR